MIIAPIDVVKDAQDREFFVTTSVGINIDKTKDIKEIKKGIIQIGEGPNQIKIDTALKTSNTFKKYNSKKGKNRRVKRSLTAYLVYKMGETKDENELRQAFSVLDNIKNYENFVEKHVRTHTNQ